MQQVRWALALPFILVGELCFDIASLLTGLSGTDIIDQIDQE